MTSVERVAMFPQQPKGSAEPLPELWANPARPLAPDRVIGAERAASTNENVLSRIQLASLDVTRHDVAREERRGRWTSLGLHTVVTHRGPLSEEAIWRYALNEVGSAASLDGVTALKAAGLQGFEDRTFVSVLHGWQPRRIRGIVVKELRHWREDDVVDTGVRRMCPPLAAIRGASWARSDRQAALILLMAAQQRIVRGGDLVEAVRRFKRLRRRALIKGVVADIVDGVQSLGELDFAAECRRRGLPEPSRQVVRKGRLGRVYLDVYFDDFAIIVEIEGAHHDDPGNAVLDALRQNDLTAEADFLRIPVTGFRTDTEAFMSQLETRLRAKGWRPHSHNG